MQIGKRWLKSENYLLVRPSLPHQGSRSQGKGSKREDRKDPVPVGIYLLKQWSGCWKLGQFVFYFKVSNESQCQSQPNSLKYCHIFQGAVRRSFITSFQILMCPLEVGFKILVVFFLSPSADSEGFFFFFSFSSIYKVYFWSRNLLFQEILKVFYMTANLNFKNFVIYSTYVTLCC